MASHSIVGQSPTDVFLNDDGNKIIIQQWDDRDEVYNIVRLDPIFVPILISWLFELISPEAVG